LGATSLQHSAASRLDDERRFESVWPLDNDGPGPEVIAIRREREGDWDVTDAPTFQSILGASVRERP
jgi:hypothetical protein